MQFELTMLTGMQCSLFTAPSGQAKRNTAEVLKMCNTRRYDTDGMQESMVRGVYQMLDNIEGQKEQVVDARGPGRFAGSEAEPRQGVRSGHMPGSVNIPFTQARHRANLGQKLELGTICPASKKRSYCGHEQPKSSMSVSGTINCSLPSVAAY